MEFNFQKRSKFLLFILLIIIDLFANVNLINAQQYVQRELDFNGRDTYANAVLRNSDSTYYILAATYDTLPNQKLILIKTDSLLNVNWAKGFNKDSAKLNSDNIIKASDTTLLIFGSSYSSSDHTSYIIKTDLSGDTLWTREIMLNGYSVHLNYLDIISDTLLLYGNYNVTFNDYTAKSILVKLNINNGQLIEATSYNLSSHITTYFSKAVRYSSINSKGYFIMGLGIRDTLSYVTDLILIKLNNDLSFNKAIVIPSDSRPSLFDELAINENSNKILCGFTYADTIGQIGKYCYVEFDSLLNINWSMKYHFTNGYAGLSGVKYVPKNNTIVCADNSTVYELDSTGNILGFNRTYSDPLYPLILGNYYASDYRDNKISWIGEVSNNLAVLKHKILISVTDLHGIGCSNQTTQSLITDPLIVFPYNDTSLIATSFILESAEIIHVSNISLNSNLICNTATSINSIFDNLNNINFYPDPCLDVLQFKIDNSILGNSSINIFSSFGNLIYEGQISGNSGQIDMSRFRSGVYFIKISSALYSGKFIKIIKL